jgi:ligand-binding sensor domain-containing protein
MSFPADVPSRLFARAVGGVMSAAILLVLVTGVARVSHAQAPGRFLLVSWQSEDGLPGNVVRSVTQAADGYLWVATAEGTVRFDGVRFTGFALEPDATLARLPPRALFAMSDGDLWIATARGGLLRWHDRRLSSVWADSPEAAAVTQVVSDGRGGVLIVRGEELWRVDVGGIPTRFARSLGACGPSSKRTL